MSLGQGGKIRKRTGVKGGLGGSRADEVGAGADTGGDVDDMEQADVVLPEGGDEEEGPSGSKACDAGINGGTVDVPPHGTDATLVYRYPVSLESDLSHLGSCTSPFCAHDGLQS